jgi:hypothetical protein
MLTLAALLLLLFVLIAVFLTFDQLVRLEYSSYRTNWEKDGGPAGFFWTSPEHRTFRGRLTRSLTRSRVSLTWLFTTPEWIQVDEQARRLVRRLRILVLIWNVGIISVVIVTPLLYP